MARCQQKENACAQKREKLINDFQELIDCMKVEPSEKPVAGQITVHKKLVCIPHPGGDTNKSARENDECENESWKKDRYKSKELKGGVLISGCDCLRRNGLQHDCPRSLCMGRPPCLVKPWPDCIPSGGSGLKGWDQVRVSKYPYKPAPCPPNDFPGPEDDGCHKAEVDCPKCVPVLMCRPDEVWECLEGKCPPNAPSTQQYEAVQTQQQSQCPLSRMMQLQECPMRDSCPENGQQQTTLKTNVIGQEVICQPGKNTLEAQLRERQRSIGCPNKQQRSGGSGGPGGSGCPNREAHQRPGYESPQVLCRASEPQPVQQILPSYMSGNGGGSGRCPIMGREKHCDPPTHVLKRPAYESLPPPPECPKPKYIHHPGGKVLPNYQQLKGGQLLTRCDCLRTNGLQDDCQLRQCGIPECLERPPDCLPAGGRGPKPRHGGMSNGMRGGENGGQCPAGYQQYVCFTVEE